MKYTVTIEFEREKHCLRCPLRNEQEDTCNLQDTAAFTWEEQMQDCPLKEVE